MQRRAQWNQGETLMERRDKAFENVHNVTFFEWSIKVLKKKTVQQTHQLQQIIQRLLEAKAETGKVSLHFLLQSAHMATCEVALQNKISVPSWNQQHNKIRDINNKHT